MKTYSVTVTPTGLTPSFINSETFSVTAQDASNAISQARSSLRMMMTKSFAARFNPSGVKLVFKAKRAQ